MTQNHGFLKIKIKYLYLKIRKKLRIKQN